MTDFTFEDLFSHYGDDLPFWFKLAQRQEGGILELGCGSGRVLLPLALAGYPVHGLDHDPLLLSRLEAVWREHDLDPARLHLGDMRRYALPPIFSLIIIPCNTLAYLDDGETQSALGRAYEHLIMPGELVVDLPNPPEILSEPIDEDEPLDTFPHPVTGHPCEVFAAQAFDSHHKTCQVEWTCHESLPDGRVIRHRYARTYYLRGAAEMESLARSAGFQPVRFYGDYTLEQLTDQSPRIIMFAMKEDRS